MTRWTKLTALAALFLLASITSASAQSTSVFVGGGGLFPHEDFDSRADIGWIGIGGIVVGIGETGFFVVGEGFYGSANHHADDDKTNVGGVLGEVGYSFSGAGEGGFYVLGGAGWLVNQLDRADGTHVNDNQAGYLGAAGYGFPLGGITGWVEGRYVGSQSRDVHFFGAIAGVQIAIGGE